MKYLIVIFFLSNWILRLGFTSYGQEDNPATGMFLDTLKSEDTELRVVISIQLDDAGNYKAAFYSIDQGGGEIVFDEVNILGTTILLKSSAGIQLKGEYSDNFSSIAGDFSQGGTMFPLELIRVEQMP